MALHKILTTFLLASFALLISCDQGKVENKEMKLHDVILSLKNYRIFFGHQSVGGEIIDGIEQLARQNGVNDLGVVEMHGMQIPMDGKGIYHGLLGKNEHPDTKNAAFKKVLSDAKGNIDIAFFKYCFIDINDGTDVNRMFTHYQDTMTELRRAYPDVTYIHVTAPLTTIQTGPKAWIKRFLRRPLSGYEENKKRNEYNDLLRKKYMDKEPLFDLAYIEAHSPNGEPTTYRYNGKTYYGLTTMYTYDGAHLNEFGRAKVAEELVVFLSKLAEKRKD
jgi:hypothetical protein